MTKKKSNKYFPSLHIELGNQSLAIWMRENKYIVHSELVRYSEMLLTSDVEQIQAIVISNFTDNVIFLIDRSTVALTLETAMSYFLSIEEFEICAKIRDLQILIEKIKNEGGNTKDSKQNKRKSKIS